VRSTIPLIVAVMLAAAAVLAQPAQPAPVPLRGRVMEADNDRPLRHALVSLVRGDTRPPAVLTDDEGRFAIDVPDPSSAIAVTKAGYASTVVALNRRAPSRALDIRLQRGAVISGRVVEQGMPAIGARVMARSADAGSNSPTYQVEADDLGEYRIGGLPPGQYIVGAISGPLGVQVIAGAERRAVPEITWARVPLLSEASTRVVDAHVGHETADVDFIVVPLQAAPPSLTGVAAEFVKSVENDAGAIRGRVVTPSGQPIRGAVVMVSGSNQSRMVVADRNGRFDAGQFRDGDYRIEVRKLGYLTLDFRPPPESQTALMVRVAGDARIHDVDIVLNPGGAIAGTIVDSAGEPIKGVQVGALRLRQQDGRTLASAAGLPRLTDDRGRYRLFGLPPGMYMVVATLDATETESGRERAPGFAPVYYPSTAHVEAAQAIAVESGSDVAGIDVTFAASATARVTGRALSAAGEPLSGRVALTVSARSGGVVAEPRVAPIARDGSFSLADVPPGDYVLHAIGERGPGVAPEFGSEYITVGELDTPALTVRTTPGATLEGRFVAEGRTTLPLRAQVLHAAPSDPDRSPPGGRGPEGLAVHDDGRFYLAGLYGPMRLTYPAPGGWYLKSVTIGGLDVTDRTFDFGFTDETFSDAEVVLSNAGARISGSVTGAADKRATEFVVIAFSTSRTNWFNGSRHLKRAVTGADGSFDVESLPPGEYYVAALDALPQDWQSPDSLDLMVQRAERVTLADGQRRTLMLQLTRR
jgi:hypothetical protein